MRRSAVTMLALAAALTGCASGGPGAVTPAVPTSVAAPARKTLTVEQAGAAYLKAVAEPNRITSALGTEGGRRNPRMDRVRALGRQMQTADRRFLDFLTRTAWPPEVQSAIDALAEDTAAGISRDARIANAKSMADIPPEARTGGAAQLVRAKLGLDVVPTSG